MLAATALCIFTFIFYRGEGGTYQMKKLIFSVLAVLGLLLAVGSPARADSITSFDLTVDEHGDATPPADAALVTIDLSSPTIATVTFDAETVGSTLFTLDNVFLNVDGDFTATATGTSTPTQGYTATMDQSLDSYGTMSLEVTPNGGHDSSEIVVTLTAVGGNSWGTSAANVLTPTCPSNGSVPTCVGGYDVPSPDGGGGYNAGQYSQGFEADAKVIGDADVDLAGYYATPESSTLLMLGAGLLALGLLATFKNKLSATA
jgi:hypothetical protein